MRAVQFVDQGERRTLAALAGPEPDSVSTQSIVYTTEIPLRGG